MPGLPVQEAPQGCDTRVENENYCFRIFAEVYLRFRKNVRTFASFSQML